MRAARRGAGAPDDLVLEHRDRLVVDVRVRLAEEPDADGRARPLERAPVGHGEAVLLGAAPEALLARPCAERCAERRAAAPGARDPRSRVPARRTRDHSRGSLGSWPA